MKPKRISMKHMRKEAPQWVFSWRSAGEAWFPKWFALFVVAAFFALLLTSVRIRVIPPAPWAARKASVIQVVDDSEGRALRVRASEGGPFPSRFDPSAWEGAAAIDREILRISRGAAPPARPALRDFPAREWVTRPMLAASGELVLPQRIDTSAVHPEFPPVVSVPDLLPRSGISLAEMPEELPPFEGPVVQAMTEETWNFLLRIDHRGAVSESLSLSGGDRADLTGLARWLRQLQFRPGKRDTERWIAVGVRFVNRPLESTPDSSTPNPSEDGTDAR
jgi:hypothetical protein